MHLAFLQYLLLLIIAEQTQGGTSGGQPYIFSLVLRVLEYFGSSLIFMQSRRTKFVEVMY